MEAEELQGEEAHSRELSVSVRLGCRFVCFRYEGDNNWNLYDDGGGGGSDSRVRVLDSDFTLLRRRLL